MLHGEDDQHQHRADEEDRVEREARPARACCENSVQLRMAGVPPLVSAAMASAAVLAGIGVAS